jgi:hypothetical protein
MWRDSRVRSRARPEDAPSKPGRASNRQSSSLARPVRGLELDNGEEFIGRRVGHEVDQTGNPADLILQAHQEIVIAAGKPPAHIPASYNFPPGE